MTKLYPYPSLAWGHTEEENNRFYAEVKRIRREAESTESVNEGEYTVTTFTMQDKGKIEYVENLDLGVPSYIKYY